MAALAILAGIGVFCWLLYNAAIYTLPFLVGAFVGFHAEQAGAGPLGGIVLGIGAGVLVLIVGRALFAHARGPVLRVAIALVFAAPAALAGYSATSMLFGLASTSEGWRQAFAIIGATAIGTVAWQRLAATLPPASDDDQRRPAQAWGQRAQHRALDPRRRPLRRSVWVRASSPDADHDREVGRPLLDRPARKALLSFKADGGDAFCLSQPPRAEHPRLTQEVTIAVASLPMASVPCSPVLPSNSLFREARPFTSTMA